MAHMKGDRGRDDSTGRRSWRLLLDLLDLAWLVE